MKPMKHNNKLSWAKITLNPSRTKLPWASAEPVVETAGGFSSTACDVHMELWFRDSTCW